MIYILWISYLYYIIFVFRKKFFYIKYMKFGRKGSRFSESAGVFQKLKKNWDFRIGIINTQIFREIRVDLVRQADEKVSRIRKRRT